MPRITLLHGRTTRHAGARRAFRSLLAAALVVPLAGCTLVVDTSQREPCSTHAECTARYGEPSACVESSCVKLLTEECTQVLPEGVLKEENTILFGFMGALTGDFASYGTPTKEGAELAFDEIQANSNGIPGAAGERQRHVGMLVCDEGTDPKKVARHLAEDVKVPAIIGPSFSGVTLDVLDVTVPDQTLVISATATSPALTNVADNGLFWRTCPSDVVQTELMKYLLVELTGDLKNAGSIPEQREPKVAILYKDDSAGRGLQLGATTMPDRSQAAPPVVSGYQDKYPNPDNLDSVDWSSHADGVVSYGPDVIMALGTSEFAQYLMPRIEAKWSLDAKPWYMLPEGDRVGQLTDFVGQNPQFQLEQRIIGTAPGARQSKLYNNFKDRFKGQFSQRPPGNLAEFAYDAAYLLVYAVGISQRPYPTGPELADALTHVSCPAAIAPTPVGPGGFLDNFKQASMDGACIDFEGASGPLDFNNATGEAVGDIAMWCLQNQGNGPSYDPPLKSYYSAAEDRIVWKNDTPIDFTQRDWCNANSESM
ncbi:MAG TPA: ABC transporter substrate-binding protein [Polyangiaceae bacterium]|nr:ABC transporter substrate-binding protein [Polyangiaceae bacterium]